MVGRQRCTLLSATSVTTSDRSLTPIFDDLPEWVKGRFTEASLKRKDWKSCTQCGVHEAEKKLMACTQCKPFRIIPAYYCSQKCQRADWPTHKAQCIELVQHATPVSQQMLENDQLPLKKCVEHWLHIHSGNIKLLIEQIFYFRTAFQLRLTAVIIHLHIDDANSDPPLAWPVKIDLVPRLTVSNVPWSKGNVDFVDYALIFPGGDISMAHIFEEYWRTNMETKGDTFPAYGPMFYNLFLAAPQTCKVATMQWHFVQAAVKIERDIPASRLLAFDAQMLTFMDTDEKSTAVKLGQSDEWLQIFKESRIWDYLNRKGYLRELMEMVDRPFQVNG